MTCISFARSRESCIREKMTNPTHPPWMRSVHVRVKTVWIDVSIWHPKGVQRKALGHPGGPAISGAPTPVDYAMMVALCSPAIPRNRWMGPPPDSLAAHGTMLRSPHTQLRLDLPLSCPFIPFARFCQIELLPQPLRAVSLLWYLDLAGVICA
jgi:hypothetical protein